MGMDIITYLHRQYVDSLINYFDIGKNVKNKLLNLS